MFITLRPVFDLRGYLKYFLSMVSYGVGTIKGCKEEKLYAKKES